MAIKAMPSTIWSAVAMSMVQLIWCLVAGIAALGSFVALETVTAPDGASYRAIDCLSGIFDEPDGSSPVTPAAPGSVCMCNGNKISDVSCRFVLPGPDGIRPTRVLLCGDQSCAEPCQYCVESCVAYNKWRVSDVISV